MLISEGARTKLLLLIRETLCIGRNGTANCQIAIANEFVCGCTAVSRDHCRGGSVSAVADYSDRLLVATARLPVPASGQAVHAHSLPIAVASAARCTASAALRLTAPLITATGTCL